jgi:TonB-linked SusC/RagA family outer membrane protein
MAFKCFTQAVLPDTASAREMHPAGRQTIVFVMRASAIGLMMSLLTLQLCYATAAKSQGVLDRKVTIQLHQTPLESALLLLQQKAGVDIIYSSRMDLTREVSLVARREKLEDVLNSLLSETQLTYEIVGGNIVIHKRPETDPPAAVEMVPQFRITGLIKDQMGNPLVGVSIQVVGTNRGVLTDDNGHYTITVSPTDSLRFSYIGYVSQTRPVKNKVDINVTMEAKEGSLNQVVVVGYGKQKKISMVGAQSSVNVEALKLPVDNLNTVLAGRLAGVVSVQRTGLPGSGGADIWIRGISTFSSSLSKPLVLVDGVPRSFTDIDPEDIASFSILKDAAATAVYGVRGANGVILITTKSGKIGKPRINFRYNEGVTAFTQVPHFVDGPTYMKMVNEASTTRGGSPLYSDEAIAATRDKTDPDLYPNVNWFNQIFNKTGYNRNGNLNISGGSEGAQYYVGLSYFDEKGLFKQDSLQKYSSQARYKRYNLTSNLTIRPTRSTTIKLGVSGFMAYRTYPGIGVATIFGDAFFGSPVNHPALYSDGKVADNYLDNRMKNPYAELTKSGYVDEWRSQLTSNLEVIQNLDFWLKGLSISGKFAFDTYNVTMMKRKKTPDTYMAIGRDSTGALIEQLTNPGVGTEYLSYSLDKSGTRTLYNEFALNYRNSFGKHDVSGMLLFNQSDELNTQATDVLTSLPYRFRGLAGRATYGYSDRYFMEFDFGYNGSENFAPQNRYGFFPSVGVGWVISKENFFRPLSNAIQLLKLRFSYGTVGNSNITGRRFAYIGTVASVTGYWYGENYDHTVSGKDIGDYASDVTWEIAKKTNLGINLEALNGQLALQADVFKEHRTGIFLERSSLPYYMGLRNAPYGNVGIIDNHGIDGTLTWQGHVGAFTYQLIGNFTWARNKVVEDDLPDYKYPWMQHKGRKVSQVFGYEALGYFTSEQEIENSPLENGNVLPGDLKFKDINGDGKIDSYDEVPIGYGEVPEIVYGVGFSFGYKAFKLTGLFQGIGNVSISVNGTGLQPFAQGQGIGNLFSNITDRWTPENPNPHAFYPRLMSGSLNDDYVTSTWWLKNGRYLRLKSLQLSYELPQAFVSRIHLRNAYVFAEGVNLLTFTPFKLYDVELGNGHGAQYPNTKTYALGMGFAF